LTSRRAEAGQSLGGGAEGGVEGICGEKYHIRPVLCVLWREARRASLSDPQKLFNAMLKGNKARAMSDKLNETALNALIRSGMEHNLAKVKRATARKR